MKIKKQLPTFHVIYALIKWILSSKNLIKKENIFEKNRNTKCFRLAIRYDLKFLKEVWDGYCLQYDATMTFNFLSTSQIFIFLNSFMCERKYVLSWEFDSCVYQTVILNKIFMSLSILHSFEWKYKNKYILTININF